MSPISVVIVDDEPLARRRLEIAVADMPGVTVIGAAADGEDAIGLIKSLKPDLVLLDVKMPVLDGFEVIAALGDEAPRIIFVTGFHQYSEEAAAAGAIAYLTKPVDFHRLKEAIELARAPQLTSPSPQ